ncbi:MAG: N-6 DNA methylase [Anaerolineae bacterium]
MMQNIKRNSDMLQARWQEAIPKYLDEVEPVNTESARSLRFGMLLQELLGFEPGFIESYVSGIEKYLKVKQKDRLLKGRADNLFGNVVIEFELDLPQKRAEAEEQLRRYVAILWTQEVQEGRRPYLCLATDGIRFVTYSPLPADPKKSEISLEDVRLTVLEETDWRELQPHEVYYWLDRYFLRQEILTPTTETVERDFGMKSHAFQTAAGALFALWQEIKTQSTFAVIYDGWEKYLRIVYGSKVAGDELFIRHTYLATLAKLMAWMRLAESTTLPDEAQIARMLEGRLFKDEHGIENFIEEDFFSWLARPGALETGVGITRRLFSLLQKYNLRELSEDVLKSLYQELVDPAARHDLGEFYTPDWLAHRIVRKLLDKKPLGSLLDPACGSGTFLYLAIQEKRKRLGDSRETLYHIQDSVCGADVHPLAVIIAKTNYVLALGDLLRGPRGRVAIPIYLADTIKLPEPEIKPTLWMQLPSYNAELGGQEIHLPELLLENLPLYDRAIELAKDFALWNKDKPIEAEPFRNFLQAQGFPGVENTALVQALFRIADALKHLIEANRDTIWAFVLKNIYKPLFFKDGFDFIVGNPPWIAFRFAEPTYQGFLKQQITKEYKLLAKSPQNISNLEIATLFFMRAADLYLKPGGIIAFVLPKSIFSADQHDALRKRSFKFSENEMQNLSFLEIWDCEGVEPLFNVPASVLIAEKGELAEMEYPIAGQTLRGALARKNASLEEAESMLTVEDVEFSLHRRGKRSFWAVGEVETTHGPSYYKKTFFRGADIHPRSFWFVQVKPSPRGFDPKLPPLETAAHAREQAKDAYKNVFFKGPVESRFLYATLLSTDLLPFGHLDYRLVVLPIEPEGDHYRLLDAEEARKRGFMYLTYWLERVEGEWKRLRGTKAERMSALEWLDYRRKLTAQNPQAKYRVIYNTSGTYLTAAIVENEPIEFEINGQKIKAQGFLADCVTYYLETSNPNETYYLSAILNAPNVDTLIKPMQARGLWGPRHICKKVLELPIPRFDASNPPHQRLAELGEECAGKVEGWLESGGPGKVKSIGRLRGMVREMLREELEEIDSLVEKILNPPAGF